MKEFFSRSPLFGNAPEYQRVLINIPKGYEQKASEFQEVRSLLARTSWRYSGIRRRVKRVTVSRFLNLGCRV